MVVKVNGTSGLIFPDNTTQATAGTAFAANQTWQAVSRSSGVTYTNSTGKPIVVSVARYGGNGSQTTLYVGGNIAGQVQVDQYGGSEQMVTIVPNGATYAIYNSNGIVSGCWELR